jgi:hypothetical protein
MGVRDREAAGGGDEGGREEGIGGRLGVWAGGQTRIRISDFVAPLSGAATGSSGAGVSIVRAADVLRPFSFVSKPTE